LISHLNPWVDPGPGPRPPQAIHHDSDRVPDTRTARAASHHLRDGSLIECAPEPTARLIPPHPRGEPTAPSRRNGSHQRPPTAPRHYRHGTQPAAAWSRARLLVRRRFGTDTRTSAHGRGGCPSSSLPIISKAAISDRPTRPRECGDWSACRFLRSGFGPQADPVAFRIAEGRDAQAAFGPSRSLDGPAVLLDPAQRLASHCLL
jgi:hypothetical protein